MIDENSVGNDNEGRSLDRRSYLKAAGGSAAVLLAGLGSSGSAAAASGDYDVVEVQENGTFSRQLGSGETFENTVIDISAPGATFDIEATGSDWTVRNIGIRGVWDQYEKAEPFRVSVDSGSTGVIENFYFADGCPDDTYAGVTGIYVYKHHAGTVKIDQTNIQDLPDNAIYASNCGRPRSSEHGWDDGAGGVVEITNSYAADCQASHFRVGSDGSFARNCVAVGGEGGHRGFLGRFNDTKAIDCDFSGHRQGDVSCGTFQWEDGADATVTLENCRFGSRDDSLSYRGNIVGESTGTPRTEPPAGVPTSAEEAAAGGPTESVDSSDDGSTGASDGDSLSKTLTVETTEGGPLVEYEFTVDGTVADGDAADANDTLTEDGDTTTVSGVTGNGYTDSFRFEGTLTDWSASVDSDNYRVLVDGEEVDLAAVGGNTLTVETTEGGPLVEYEFTVDGTVADGDAADANDTITEDGDTTTVSGVTGNGYTDSFRFEGTLTDWSASVDSDNYRVLVDGEEVDLAAVGGNTLSVETTEGGPLVEYEFTVDGTVADGDAADANDTITEDGDTTTVSGVTGNGYTDSFRFEGELTDWSASVDSDNYRVLVDGEEVDATGIGGPTTLTVETDADCPMVVYEFAVDGSVSKGPTAEDGSSVASDTISDGDPTTVTGVTGRGFTDDYEFEGTLLNWSANLDPDEYRLLLDDEEADPSEL